MQNFEKNIHEQLKIHMETFDKMSFVHFLRGYLKAKTSQEI